MSDWTPGNLRALAAYVIQAEGTWPATGLSAWEVQEGGRIITTVAENTFGDEQGEVPDLTEADVATVKQHIRDAVVVIDGEHFGNGI